MALLEFKNVTKYYPSQPPLVALNDVSFQIERKAFTVLVGPSGSGKTTLLNIASGLDRPSSGIVFVDDQELSKMSAGELCAFRREKLGFVFQSYNLFPALTAVENVEFTNLLRGENRKHARSLSVEALLAVGLGDKLNCYPNNLSGGQQQRVAVARALATQAKIIFADEPTANLDTTTAFQLIDLFEELNVTQNVSFLFSTHDHRLVDRAKQRLELEDGKLATSRVENRLRRPDFDSRPQLDA